MIFALAYLGNAAANFVFGLVVSAALGPAEFGRYATAALAASVLAALAFDWLRLSTNRFWLSQARPGARFGERSRPAFFLVERPPLRRRRARLLPWLRFRPRVGTSSP